MPRLHFALLSFSKGAGVGGEVIMFAPEEVIMVHTLPLLTPHSLPCGMGGHGRQPLL